MRRPSLLTAAVAAGALLHSLSADAIVLQRITRRGYIVSSDTELWGSTIPVDSTVTTVQFISAVTAALSKVDGFHEGQYLAAMQIPTSTSALAFYLPIRNDVRGIGQRSPLDNRSEVFDLNGVFGSSFPLDGFVFLNTYRFYTDPRAVEFGRYLICTQEFGHRFGATFRANVTASPDAGVADAGAADGGAALAADSYLGRGNQLPSGMVVNRSHWSYFFNSGGSPMEGNVWTESPAGTFRTSMPSFRFSPMDLYAMGLIPASEVPPTFLIADPTTSANVTRDSPPEYNGRSVIVRGRRVDVTINDLVRANGARNPAYDEEAPHDMDVVWVLLANESQINDQLVRDFDTAVDSCSQGYSFATSERSHLVTTVPDVGQFADAAVEDAAVEDAAVDDAAVEDAASDAGTDATRPITPATPGEGCNCRTAPVKRGATGPALFALALASLTYRRARRRAGDRA